MALRRGGVVCVVCCCCPTPSLRAELAKNMTLRRRRLFACSRLSLRDQLVKRMALRRGGVVCVVCFCVPTSSVRDELDKKMTLRRRRLFECSRLPLRDQLVKRMALRRGGGVWLVLAVVAQHHRGVMNSSRT